MRHHPGGSHSNHAQPDGRMSPTHNQVSRWQERTERLDWHHDLTSTQRQATKAVANAKRRQRDRATAQEEF